MQLLNDGWEKTSYQHDRGADRFESHTIKKILDGETIVEELIHRDGALDPSTLKTHNVFKNILN